MKITFESKPVYGEDVKYIKTKIKTCRQHNHKFSSQKNAKRKSTMYMFINNNDRFSY